MRLLKGLFTFIFTLICILSLTACSDDNDSITFKSKGKEATKEEMTEAFNELSNNRDFNNKDFIMIVENDNDYAYSSSNNISKIITKNTYKYDYNNHIIDYSSYTKYHHGKNAESSENNTSEIYQENELGILKIDPIEKEYEVSNYSSFEEIETHLTGLAYTAFERFMIADTINDLDYYEYKYYVNKGTLTIEEYYNNEDESKETIIQLQFNKNSILLLSTIKANDDYFIQSSSSLKLEFENVKLAYVNLKDYTYIE